MMGHDMMSVQTWSAELVPCLARLRVRKFNKYQIPNHNFQINFNVSNFKYDVLVLVF